MNVGKPTINSILTENKPFRIDTQKMQHCRVEIVAVRLPFRGLMPPVIAVPVARARLDPSARQVTIEDIERNAPVIAVRKVYRVFLGRISRL